VHEGHLVTPGGARYKALFLGQGAKIMSLATLRRIAALVDAGAVIIGTAPAPAPALEDDRGAFAALVQRLWGAPAQAMTGTGRVIATDDAEAGLARIGLRPDFDGGTGPSADQLTFVHRTMDNAEIYYVSNRGDHALDVSAQFRVTGKRPEVWRADNGAIHALPFTDDGAVTSATLSLEAEEAVFVVFGDTDGKARSTPPERLKERALLTGDWQVFFQPGRGAPDHVQLETLASLSESSDPAVKYFSGIATYKRSLRLSRADLTGKPLVLDLGAVGDLAEVFVNDKPAGSVWHSPYTIDITGLLKAGENKLEIRVANLWVNRLIGDAQPDAKKVTFTTISTHRANAPLRPSGLIGPVRLLVGGK
jgi:hypothetical protein